MARVFALVVLLSACKSDETRVLVDLKTDLVAGVEFVLVRTTLTGQTPRERGALYGDDFLEGERVAVFDDVTRGPAMLDVELLSVEGTVVVSRRFRFDADGLFGLTALLTRSCREVTCPSEQTCVAGSCVSQSCLEADDPGCPAPQCTSAIPCTPSPVACGVARCDEGVCLYGDDGTCGADRYCNLDMGCAELPGDDAGVDAAVDAATDGMPTFAPLASFSAEPLADGAEGEVLLVWTYPPNIGDATRLELRRAETVPADCASGRLIATITDFSESSVVDRVDDRWIRRHGYRACFVAEGGESFSDDVMTLRDIAFANPGPGCHFPPCTNPRSTVRTIGLPQRAPSGLGATGARDGDLALGDFDGDGDLDVVIATTTSNVVQLNDGAAGFGLAISLDAPANSMNVSTGDFDNDGNLDVVFANRDAPSVVHLGNGDGTFGPARDVDSGFPLVFDVETADLNGDTFLDLIITAIGARDRIFLGDGTGDFTFLSNLEEVDADSCVNCLELRDVNGDDVVDIVLAYNRGDTRLDVFLGNGDATFQSPIAIPFDTNTPIVVKLADLDADGNDDVLVGRSLGGGIFVGFGNGTGNFTGLMPLNTMTSSRTYGLAALDFDGDGHVDIAFSEDDDGIVGFLRGIGDGTFEAQVDLDPGNTYTTTNMDAGDLNGDGKLDFVCGAATGNSLVFLGD